MESIEPEPVYRLINRLGLNSACNTSYPEKLKAMLGLPAETTAVVG